MGSLCLGPLNLIWVEIDFYVQRHFWVYLMGFLYFCHWDHAWYYVVEMDFGPLGQLGQVFVMIFKVGFFGSQ